MRLSHLYAVLLFLNSTAGTFNDVCLMHTFYETQDACHCPAVIGNSAETLWCTPDHVKHKIPCKTTICGFYIIKKKEHIASQNAIRCAEETFYYLSFYF